MASHLRLWTHSRFWVCLGPARAGSGPQWQRDCGAVALVQSRRRGWSGHNRWLAAAGHLEAEKPTDVHQTMGSRFFGDRRAVGCILVRPTRLAVISALLSWRLLR